MSRRVLSTLMPLAALILVLPALAWSSMTVRNGSGSSIGGVDGDGTIRNSSGSSVGRVDSDGTLRNGSGSSVGRLDDCTVRNSSGSSRGRFDGCVPADRHAMAAYLFFFEPLHNH